MQISNKAFSSDLLKQVSMNKIKDLIIDDIEEGQCDRAIHEHVIEFFEATQ